MDIKRFFFNALIDHQKNYPRDPLDVDHLRKEVTRFGKMLAFFGSFSKGAEIDVIDREGIPCWHIADHADHLYPQHFEACPRESGELGRRLPASAGIACSVICMRRK